MMMILGQPLFWPATHPSYMSSPLFMHCGGHNIDLASSCHKQLSDCMSTVKTVAADPVASATFCHGTEQAVCVCLSRVGAADGDGGALGKVQAYIDLDRGENSAYTAGPSVSVGIRLQQSRAAEIRPGDEPEENVARGVFVISRWFLSVSPMLLFPRAGTVRSGTGSRFDPKKWQIYSAKTTKKSEKMSRRKKLQTLFLLGFRLK